MSAQLNSSKAGSMICVVIARTRHRMMIEEHRALAQRGAPLVELRVDWLQRPPDLQRLLQDRPTPVIITCRRPQDGGRWRGTEEERQRVLRAAIVAGVEYVDLEWDIARQIRRYGKTRRIISYHNFEKTPEDLEAIHAEMCELDADVVKVVTLAHSPVDAVRVLRLISGAKRPTVAFCMGEFGQFSRILCGRFGAPFTYAAFSRDRELAPGQITFDDMHHMYHYEQIQPGTHMFGVLGDPISHSLSPLLHNTAMQQLGYDGVYVPLRVAAEHFHTALDALQNLGFEGFSVTIPHKEAALQRHPICEPVVEQIGAANTLYRDQQGAWHSDNTDCQAALEALQTVLREEETLEGKRVLLLGAGGAARALGFGLLHAGAALVVTSRTAERARQLAQRLGCRFVTWENRGSESCDILINCTPVGMHPHVDDSPYHQHWLREEMIVFDTVYNPEQTLLVRQARDRNCRVVTGSEMFIRQAAAQIQLFTGQAVSLDLLRQTFKRGISAAKL